MKKILNQYFLSFKRHLLKSLIIILGFSISLAVIITLVFFIIQEKSYDKKFKNIDNIYMVLTTKNESYVEEDTKEILVNTFPQIESACRYYNFKTYFIYNQGFIEGNMVTTDEGFFDVFSIQFLYGNNKAAFENNQGIVLTETYAKRIFKNNFPIGQSIVTLGGKIFQVTGVIKDLPKRSSINADCFIHYKSKIHFSGINSIPTTGLFILVKPEILTKDFETSISNTLINSSKILNNNIMSFGEEIEWKLRPFKTAYFDVDLKKDHLEHANIRLIKIISIISIIVLFMAIINYVNLSTVEGFSRFKEIGIRKAYGASNSKIYLQFLFESIITCSLSSLLAFLLTQLISPIFGILVNKKVDFIDFNIFNVFCILLSVFFLGIFAGLFPALIASKHSPNQLFHSSNKIILKSSSRNILNIFQFSISIGLIICLITILKQTHYSQNRDIGFNTKYLINVDYSGSISKASVVADYLHKNSNILSVSFSQGTPKEVGHYSGSTTPFKSIGILSADDKFIETFEFKLVNGRNIEYPSEIKECLITENAFKETGWANIDDKTLENYKIVGVINSFNSDNLHLPASNIMIKNSATQFSSLSIRISPNKIAESLNYIQNILATIYPDFGFRYSFYDEWIEQTFSNERNHARIAIAFGLLSILLSCLGLLGLADYSMRRRAKEIGIRKINGAKAIEIMIMLNKDFVFLVGVAFGVAIPIAYLVMKKWLEGFAYKTVFSWWIFAVSGIIVGILLILTVSWQSWKASSRNPVEVLASE
jgi:putative ABC transport system permease protein